MLLHNSVSSHQFNLAFCKQYSIDNKICNFINDVPLVVSCSSEDVDIELSCIYVTKSVMHLQIQPMLQGSVRNNYCMHSVDQNQRTISLILSYSNTVVKVNNLLITTNVYTVIKCIAIAFKLSPHISTVDVSWVRIDDTFCQMLCSLIIKSKRTRHLKELNVSSNQLTAFSLNSIAECLQHCCIQQLIMFHNNFEDGDFRDAFLVHCKSKNYILNFKLGIPLVIVHSSPTQSCAVTVLIRNVHFNQNFISDIFENLKGYHITHCKIIVSQSVIMVDDLSKSLSLLHNPLSICLEFFVYETGLKDKVAEQVAACLSKQCNINIIVHFILVSETQLIANKIVYPLIVEKLSSDPAIVMLELRDCDLKPLQLKTVFIQNTRYWRLIDLSHCKLEDDIFKSLVDCFSLHTVIATLDVSHNCLTTASTITICNLLSRCIIKNLIISNNEIQDYDILEMVCIHQWTTNNFLNFKSNTSLVITSECTEEKNVVISNAYIMDYNFDIVEKIISTIKTNYPVNIYFINSEYGRRIYFNKSDPPQYKLKASNAHELLSKFEKVLIFKSRYINLIDISKENISREVLCSVLYQSAFGVRSSITNVQVNELNVVLIQCASFCILDLFESVHRSNIDKILVFDNAKMVKLLNLMLQMYWTQIQRFSTDQMLVTFVGKPKQNRNNSKFYSSS